ncbi:MAG: threonine synthase [Desulfurococcales archaeon ex4484_42]|nr:MAG: threonine synthase [Desulfurococcales archaeon ex4484_42]
MLPTRINSTLKTVYCTRCGATYDPSKMNTICPKCGGVLYVDYDMEYAKTLMNRDLLRRRPRSLGLWRFMELLPVKEGKNVVSLGEGATPLIRAKRLGEILGLKNLYIKDESLNPTGTFKARGLSVAVSKALELGIKKVGMPSSGNAGAALAAYATRAGIKAIIYAPKDTPKAMLTEMTMYGAELRLVEGTIADAGRELSKVKDVEGIFDMSTMKEPYRLEGKKTMGYEIVEDLDWIAPDAIIYPTGGGTGLLGIWKGINELRVMGLLKEEKLPRMVSVQSIGCAPIVKAFHEGKEYTEAWTSPKTIAPGIKVPKPYADYLILKVLRESKGTAIAVSDNEILNAIKELSKTEGILPCPEGASTLAALHKLLEQGLIDKDEVVVLVNTGSGLKYIDLINQYL